jgi:hypothetical protein
MNAFWKGLIASVAVYQLVLTYCMLYLADYFLWIYFSSNNYKTSLLQNAATGTSVMILGGALIVLLAFNLVLYVSTRPFQDG